LLSPFLWASCSVDSSDFGGLFRYSHARFLAWHDPDWLYLRAQGIAESNLDPNAVSPVGAAGVMQFMPGTWGDCERALNIRASRFSPKASIICGGWYMDRMLRAFTSPRSTIERWRWAWSAYNWGLGSVLRAQKRIGGRTEYRDLESELPAETRGYVARIERIRG
jgi:membrane-bound lytic murein transglycosylase F